MRRRATVATVAPAYLARRTQPLCAEAFMRLSNILVATDFSADSERALETALGLVSRDDGGRVTLLHVCQVPAYAAPGLGMYMPSPEQMSDIIDAARVGLDAQRARAVEHGAPVDIDVQWVVGAPAEEIVRFAAERHYDLIVVGSHGRRGLRRLLLGSVAESVVRTARTPVLTVHAPAEAAVGTAEAAPPAE
jgi:nucleotide-binding universal stress UspA family protein